MDLRGLLLVCLYSRMMLPPSNLIQKPVVDTASRCLNVGRPVSQQQQPGSMRSSLRYTTSFETLSYQAVTN